jgi:hypothetical protein
MRAWDTQEVISKLEEVEQTKHYLIKGNACCFLGAVALSMGAEVRVDVLYEDEHLIDTDLEMTLTPFEINKRIPLRIHSLFYEFYMENIVNKFEIEEPADSISFVLLNDYYRVTFSQFIEVLKKALEGENSEQDIQA